jgi:hypothetical protein
MARLNKQRVALAALAAVFFFLAAVIVVASCRDIAPRPSPPSPSPSPPAVANDRPLIGILAQACHDCPGR